MQRVRLVKNVRVHDLPFPSPTITLDELGRVEQTRYDFTSIRVQYDVSWIGETNDLDTYEETITDLP